MQCGSLGILLKLLGLIVPTIRGIEMMDARECRRWMVSHPCQAGGFELGLLAKVHVLISMLSKMLARMAPDFDHAAVRVGDA